MLRLISSPLRRYIDMSNSSLRFLTLSCLVFAARSYYPRMVFNYIWQPRDTIEHNLLLSTLLTNLVTRRKNLDLAYYLWLLSMAFEANYLAVQCRDAQAPKWYRLCFFCIAIGQVCTILLIALKIEDVECSTCLQERFSLAAVTREGRNTRPVYFVSTPAFGPPWLVGKVKRLQDQIVAQVVRLNVYYAGGRLSNEEKIMVMSGSRYMAKIQEVLTYLTLFLINMIAVLRGWLRSSESPTLKGQISMMVLTLLAGSASKGFVWTAWDLLCHHALEVDGVMYELKRTGWFKDSIELRAIHAKRTNIEASGKEILSRTHEGETFFTHDEILKCGKHNQDPCNS